MARKKTLVEEASLTPEQLKTLVRVMKDPFFFSTFCYVINPVLGMVKFLLYPFQKAVLYQFMLNRFNIILKFRQAGITELISLYCLWLAMYHPNKKINIISIKDTVAKKVLKKIKFMYKNLPSYLQEPIINGRAGEFGSVSTIEFANGSVIESTLNGPSLPIILVSPVIHEFTIAAPPVDRVGKADAQIVEAHLTIAGS